MGFLEVQLLEGSGLVPKSAGGTGTTSNPYCEFLVLPNHLKPTPELIRFGGTRSTTIKKTLTPQWNGEKLVLSECTLEQETLYLWVRHRESKSNRLIFGEDTLMGEAVLDVTHIEPNTPTRMTAELQKSGRGKISFIVTYKNALEEPLISGTIERCNGKVTWAHKYVVLHSDGFYWYENRNTTNHVRGAVVPLHEANVKVDLEKMDPKNKLTNKGMYYFNIMSKGKINKFRVKTELELVQWLTCLQQAGCIQIANVPLSFSPKLVKPKFVAPDDFDDTDELQITETDVNDVTDQTSTQSSKTPETQQWNHSNIHKSNSMNENPMATRGQVNFTSKSATAPPALSNMKSPAPSVPTSAKPRALNTSSERAISPPPSERRPQPQPLLASERSLSPSPRRPQPAPSDRGAISPSPSERKAQSYIDSDNRAMSPTARRPQPQPQPQPLLASERSLSPSPRRPQPLPPDNRSQPKAQSFIESESTPSARRPQPPTPEQRKPASAIEPRNAAQTMMKSSEAPRPKKLGVSFALPEEESKPSNNRPAPLQRIPSSDAAFLVTHPTDKSPGAISVGAQPKRTISSPNIGANQTSTNGTREVPSKAVKWSNPPPRPMPAPPTSVPAKTASGSSTTPFLAVKRSDVK